MIPETFYKGLADALREQKFHLDFDIETIHQTKGWPRPRKRERTALLQPVVDEIKQFSRMVAFCYIQMGSNAVPVLVPVIDAQTAEKSFFEGINAQLEPLLLRYSEATTIAFLGPMSAMMSGYGKIFAEIFYVFDDSAKAEEYNKTIQHKVTISHSMKGINAGGWAIDVPGEKIHEGAFVHIVTNGRINNNNLKKALFGHK